MMQIIKFVIVSTLLLSSKFASADDWGCTVALCVANPSGPIAVAECVAPVKKLWRELAKGNSFPTCNGMDGSIVNRGSIGANEYNCPVQYLQKKSNYSSTKECTYSGYISVFNSGVEISRIWWNKAGEHSTQNLVGGVPASEGSIKFMQDYEAWINRVQSGKDN